MTASTKTSRSGEGFTLVEMLMAMLILTVGLLGLLQSLNVAYDQGLRDRVRQEAVLLAEEQMHDWHRMAFKAITASRSFVVPRTVAGIPRSFSVTREQSWAGSSKRLRLAVSWTIKGHTVMHEIFTLKTE